MRTTRPTRAVLGWLAAAGVLHLLSLLTGDAWLSLASRAALVLPLVAVVFRPRLESLVVSCDVVRTTSGAEVVTRLQVRNAGRRASPALTLTEPAGLLTPVTVAVPSLAPGGSATAQVRRTALRRGVADSTVGRLRSRAPLGL
ncbi:MAG: hypothetical protein M3N21_08675, partial [Actinomycetota bacterium]|nr:hypothetical protein [Actinomycetota bacterium]